MANDTLAVQTSPGGDVITSIHILLGLVSHMAMPNLKRAGKYYPTICWECREPGALVNSAVDYCAQLHLQNSRALWKDTIFPQCILTLDDVMKCTDYIYIFFPKTSERNTKCSAYQHLLIGYSPFCPLSFKILPNNLVIKCSTRWKETKT